ncbi:MAG: hypothetical protein H6573_36295, partial [Lewinellaceae bacterium]|nr:hypothetical protein [Lewinellaceae bacterium]
NPQHALNSPEAVSWAASDEATKNDRTLTSWRQQLTLFDMSKMRKILEAIGGDDPYETCNAKIKEQESSLAATIYEDHNSKYYAFKSAIPILFPGYVSFSTDWNAAIIKQMSNRKQFQWEGSEIPTGLILGRKY